MAHSPKGELDLGKLQPTSDYTRGDLEEFVYRLRRYGYKGQEYGSQAIYDEQRRLFKPHNNNGGVISRSTIERRINDAPNDGKNAITFAPNDTTYDDDSVPSQWKSYVARLSMISQFMWDKPLTGREAIAAEYVGASFNDPFGDEVDLIPQLAIVRYVSDLRNQGTAGVKDLKVVDRYLMYAPWKFGTGLFKGDSKALWSYEEGIAFPVPDFVMFANKEEGWKWVSTVFEDALRQLGLPYYYFYWGYDTDKVTSIITMSYYGDMSKGKCNWKTILESGETEAWVDAIEPTERLAEIASVQSLAPWLTKYKWKEIKVVPYEEVTYDQR